MKNTILPNCLFCILFSQSLFAQLPPACPSPTEPPAEDCQNACIVCEGLDGYTGINNGAPSGGNSGCAGIAVHNDQWLGFVAGNGTIVITVTSSNCQNGNGLQMALFGNCGDNEAILCNSGSPGGADVPLVLEYDNFTIGEVYFLMIDGWSGDVCDYIISVSPTNAMQAPPLGNVIGGIEGPATVCPGAVVEYSISEVANAAGYLWSAPPGWDINGQNSSITIGGSQGTSVTVTAGVNGGQMCVQPVSPCQSGGEQVCKAILMQPIPPTILPPLIVCDEWLPYTWPEEPFPTLSTPGTFNLTSSPYASYLGCDSIVKQTIIINAPLWVNLGTKYICEGSCFEIGDSNYCNSGFYSHYLTSWQGCDSLVNFTLAVLPINTAANIQVPQGQTITCTNPSLSLQGINLPNLVHIWTNGQGDTISTATSITVSTAGLYTHQVVLSQGGVSCEATQKILIKKNNTPPPFTAMGGILDAMHPTVQLMGNSIISGVAYLWTGPNGFASMLKNPIVSVPGFYTLTVTNPQTGCNSSITVEVTLMN